MLNGIKVGLALGGGGWRGLAHIGVLKALEENNIPIDFIAGTSVGALVGGLYCYFGNAQSLEEFILKFGYKDLFKAISDPKLKSGLIKGEKFIKYINELTDNAEIEDLRIPFCAVATDLISGNKVYINKGNLAGAIKSSVSIPVVFQPTCRDGMCLVDGGVVENIPVLCAKSMGAEFIISVNLNTKFFPMSEKDVKTSSGIAFATSRLMLDQLAKELIKETDVLIEPDIPHINRNIGPSYFLKFIKEKELIEVGEQATKKVLPEIKKKLGRD